MARQVVHSPEQYRLELPLAGPTSRILAYAIDYVAILSIQLLLIALVLVLTPLGHETRSFFSDVSSARGDPAVLDHWAGLIFGFLVVTQLVVEWFYFIVLELTTRGRSLGKAIVKLRVVGDGGHPLRVSQSLARNLLRAVDMLPGYYAVGLIAMVALDEGKRLGDLAAGTTVIRLDRPAPLAMFSRESPESDDFRFDHQQLAKVGQREERLMRQTLRRLPELSAEQAAPALERAVEVITARIGHEPVPADQRVDFLRSLLRAAERR